MSDLMLIGILCAPFEDRGDLHLMQLREACREAAQRIEADADAIATLQRELEAVKADALLWQSHYERAQDSRREIARELEAMRKERDALREALNG